jgi:hypothetical protein
MHPGAWSLAAILLVATCVWAGPKPKGWSPSVDASRFVNGVDNQYFPLTPGRTLVYRSRDGAETMEFEVTNRTKVVMDVVTTVVVERHREDGQLVEVSENWFAQDQDGTVWYFGEFSQSIENGVPVSTEGSWEAGVAGALPGIIMLAIPQQGDKYFEEFAEGVAEDQAQVMSTSRSETTPLRSFSRVLRIKEWTKLEPGSIEFKYYAPDVGLIVEEKGSQRLELVQIRG